MLETILFLVHAALLLLFGIYLSIAFAGISFTRKNLLNAFLLCLLCGILQTVAYLSLPEDVLWKLYPLNTHLPLILFYTSHTIKNLLLHSFPSLRHTYGASLQNGSVFWFIIFQKTRLQNILQNLS